MFTKKIGYFLTTIGAVIFLASVLTDLVISGDTGIGASQILGIIAGMTLILLGIFLVLLYPNRAFDIRSGGQSVLQLILDLPVSVWVLVGFGIVYAAFYLFPVFFNAERSMWYFNRYIDNRNPIGVDIQAVMRYIQDWLVSSQSPYSDGFIAYPPLALVLFSPLLLFGYPSYYFFMTVLTFLFHAGSALLVSLFVKRNQNVSIPFLVFGLSIFSYGFQFELERGQFNIIAFSLCLIAIYIFHSHYEYRYVAYLLFTLGVQLKIYPVILIVMFIRDWRDWKGNLKRLAGIALLNFALLFILGFQLFGGFLRAVAGQQSLGTTWNGNHSLKGFVSQLTQDGFGLFQPETLIVFQQYRGWIEMLLLVTMALCLLSVIIHSYAQNSSGPNPILLLICTICALVIPSISNDYKLPLLTAPVAAAFISVSLPENRWRKIVAILLLLIMSTAYWSTLYPFTGKPYFLTRNFPALFILLIAATLLNFVAFVKQDAMRTEKIKD